MSREDPQMKIRLPADLKDQIEAAAKDSGRSMNAEIVARLEESLKHSGAQKGAEFAGVLNRLLDAENLQITENGVRLTLKIDVEPAAEKSSVRIRERAASKKA
ncbi:UNVERIFIED_ORG: hypothetical protein HNP28_001010 [Comamonas terrigena]